MLRRIFFSLFPVWYGGFSYRCLSLYVRVRGTESVLLVLDRKYLRRKRFVRCVRGPSAACPVTNSVVVNVCIRALSGFDSSCAYVGNRCALFYTSAIRRVLSVIFIIKIYYYSYFVIIYVFIDKITSRLTKI